MISKLLVGGFFALLVSACGDAGTSAAPIQATGDTAAAQDTTQAQDEDVSFEAVKLRAHRTPRRIQRFDANHDGMLQASEVPPRLRAWFVAVDANHDNVVTADEIRAYNRAHPHPHGQHHHQHAQQPTEPQHASETTL